MNVWDYLKWFVEYMTSGLFSNLTAFIERMDKFMDRVDQTLATISGQQAQIQKALDELKQMIADRDTVIAAAVAEAKAAQKAQDDAAFNTAMDKVDAALANNQPVIQAIDDLNVDKPAPPAEEPPVVVEPTPEPTV